MLGFMDKTKQMGMTTPEQALAYMDTQDLTNLAH